MKPICVDLDGTLIHTDLFYETAFILIKENPVYLFIIPWLALMKGRGFIKNYVAEKVSLDIDLLPINYEALNFIRNQKQLGRTVILVTGSNDILAEKFCDKYNFFDGCFGSTSSEKLTGMNKAEFLVNKFGERGFDYMGDSKADLHVWKVADDAFYIKGNLTIENKIKRLKTVIPSYKFSFYQWLRLLRVYQWVKNLLIFTPVIFARRYGEIDLWISTLWAFVLFSMMASAVYLFNDLLDIPSDRKNAYKNKRPLATGRVSIKAAITLLPFLILIPLILGYIHNQLLFYALLGYFVANLLYTFKVKSMPMLDILFLTGFYLVRIVIGGLVTGIFISFWFRVFAFFIFLSLGLLKRFIELWHYKKDGEIPGRGYQLIDLQMIEMMGVGSGLISILVFTLYLFMSTAMKEFNNSISLWPVSIALLYWISMMWFKARRGEILDDPVKFALKDKLSWIIATFIVVVIVTSL